MSQETLYELYFVNVLGHIVDVRDISHISPVKYDRYDDRFEFDVTQKGAADYHRVTLHDGSEAELKKAYDVLVEAHAKLWLPYPETKTDDTTDTVLPQEVTENV